MVVVRESYFNIKSVFNLVLVILFYTACYFLFFNSGEIDDLTMCFYLQLPLIAVFYDYPKTNLHLMVNSSNYAFVGDFLIWFLGGWFVYVDLYGLEGGASYFSILFLILSVIYYLKIYINYIKWLNEKSIGALKNKIGLMLFKFGLVLHIIVLLYLLYSSNSNWKLLSPFDLFVSNRELTNCIV